MISVLKSVTVLVAGTVLSAGFCLSSASAAYANQSSLPAIANQGAFVSETSNASTSHITKAQNNKQDAKNRVDSIELGRLKANLDEAVKEHGTNSWIAFLKGRYLLQWYIDHNQIENAVPLCESLVEYCRESAGTAIGANEIALNTINTNVIGTQDGALSASMKQDHNNLILCLTVLSELNDRLGRIEKSADLMDDARNTYKDCQLRNYESRAQSFEQFIEHSSVPNTVTQSKLSSLLNWREY